MDDITGLQVGQVAALVAVEEEEQENRKERQQTVTRKKVSKKPRPNARWCDRVKVCGMLGDRSQSMATPSLPPDAHSDPSGDTVTVLIWEIEQEEDGAKKGQNGPKMSLQNQYPIRVCS